MEETVTPPLVNEEELARSFEALGEARMVPILRTFGATAVEEAQAVAQALTAGEGDRARRLAHGLKGAASYMSATRLARSAEAIETMHEPGSGEHILPSLLLTAHETAEWIARRFPG